MAFSNGSTFETIESYESQSETGLCSYLLGSRWEQQNPVCYYLVPMFLLFLPI
jgi:hypothetical protein